MTTTSATARRSSSAGPIGVDAADSGQVPSAPFMLTLCQFQGPVSIRPPQSPYLKRFTFFTTNARQHDGGELVYLHMGYFETLADAQNVLSAVRRRFPQAIASRAPAASLTDTQVMRILESRGAGTAHNHDAESSSAQIAVIRPEDTSTRRALKEAVAEGAPVYFAIQLDWSDRPMSPGRVPTLPVFKTHTLYETESHREGRRRYFLRLGFFSDAGSAKEAASSVRSKFTSAVVVPVTEQEITRAHEASTDGFGFARVRLPVDQAPEQKSVGNPAPKPQPYVNRPRRNSRNTETLEQTLETLAARESWNDPDSPSDTGVRHLKVEVLERESGDS